MGSCLSGFAPPHLLDVVDGNEDDYQQRYLEEKVLGEGEFGVVKLVYDMHLQQKQKTAAAEVSDAPPPPTTPPTPFACKILQKGVVFKDNVLYTPLKPEVLRGEIQMLRTLAGQCYCVSLIAVYESMKRLYVITECCTGGTMTQYVAASSMTSFTTMDVSRISYQLLLAIQHCAKYHIIHRDIKPDNIMFTHPGPGADVRLIDFGSGCMDTTCSTDNSNNMGEVDSAVSTTSTKKKIEYINGQRVHTTFAGSAFYISPELYNRSYTLMTDIWSVGVTLYVLVAGYPADALQKAFNILQTDSRDLHTLPNIPNNDILPESFYTLLNGCLTYWYQHRPNATTLLQYEFVTLHQQQSQPLPQQSQQVPPPKQRINDSNETTLETTTEDDYDYYDNGDDEDDEEAKISEFGRMMSTKSYGTTMSHPEHSLRGSVLRHNIFLNFQQYERSLTALLATLLSKSELEQLVFVLNKRVLVRISGNGGGKDGNGNGEDQFDMIPPSNNNKNTPAAPILLPIERSGIKEQQQLAVVPISELKAILYDDLLKGDILDQIDKLSQDKNQYDNFAYHTALLNDFVRNQTKNNKSDGLTSSAHFVRGRNGFGGGGSIRQMTGSNASSVNSNYSSSMMMMRRGSNSNSNNNLKNVFKSMSKKKSTTKSSSSSMKRSVSTSAF